MHNTIMEKPVDISLRIIAILFVGVLEILIAPFKATGKICLIVFEEILAPIHGSISNIVTRLEEKAANAT